MREIDVRAPSRAIVGDRRRECQFGLVFGLAFGLVAGFAGGLANGLIQGFVYGLIYGITGGLVYAIGSGLVSSAAWPTALANALQRRGETPARLLRFLSDAHERKILRTVGPVYQFRADRLQDRLAELRDTVPT